MASAKHPMTCMTHTVTDKHSKKPLDWNSFNFNSCENQIAILEDDFSVCVLWMLLFFLCDNITLNFTSRVRTRIAILVGGWHLCLCSLNASFFPVWSYYFKFQLTRENQISILEDDFSVSAGRICEARYIHIAESNLYLIYQIPSALKLYCASVVTIKSIDKKKGLT